MNRVRRLAAGAAVSSRELATHVKALASAGDEEAAREEFGELVTHHQRRASRLAYYYLRNGAEADEAVQDAFLKAYMALDRFDERLSFDIWFTRILVNGCLDRLKARGRRTRWMVKGPDGLHGKEVFEPAVDEPTPEEALLKSEAGQVVRAAIDALPDRQRTVVALTQLDGRSTSEVSEMTGLNEATVRVHLFRAMRRLRQAFGKVKKLDGESRR
jgi:RNA polymerase sigma-70 factor (ECF subfamily)